MKGPDLARSVSQVPPAVHGIAVAPQLFIARMPLSYGRPAIDLGVLARYVPAAAAFALLPPWRARTRRLGAARPGSALSVSDCALCRWSGRMPTAQGEDREDRSVHGPLIVFTK